MGVGAGGVAVAGTDVGVSVSVGVAVEDRPGMLQPLKPMKMDSDKKITGIRCMSFINMDFIITVWLLLWQSFSVSLLYKYKQKNINT